MPDSHLLWAYAHILLFVFWLGADVGVWLIMAMVRNLALGFDTRATLIRLAFQIDLSPRICFALMLPVGLQLVRGLGLYPISNGLLALGWVLGLSWAALHVVLLVCKGTPLARRLNQVNRTWELVAGAVLITVAVLSLTIGAPVAAGWLALKLLLFGLAFWVTLGIDTVFQPFTTLLKMGPDGSTPEKEAVVRRLTHRTMAWALLLYALVAGAAFLGKVKPF